MWIDFGNVRNDINIASVSSLFAIACSLAAQSNSVYLSTLNEITEQCGCSII